MSIVTVHGPYTFGSKAIVERGPLVGTVNPANGLIWDFRLDGATTRANADFSWAFPADGTPTPQALANPTPVTYATPGTKTVTLTVTGAGTGANPYPPAGVYTVTINAVAGVAPLMVEEEEAAVPTEAAAPAEAEAATEVYVPGDHTVAEVQAYVTAHPDELEAVYEAEVAGKNRSTLVVWLEEQFPYDPGAWTVQEVVDYATANPDDLEDIIAAEQAGKNRTTLLSQLEAMR
jgi:hypothetical protein